MANTWFVRPNTLHNTTRNGNSYATAWGGWSEILWGAASDRVSPGDTLYVCGAHTYSAVIEAGAAGVTIRSDYPTAAGSITLTGVNVYFNVNKSSLTFQSLTISSGDRCFMPTNLAITGLSIKNCTLNGSSLPAIEFRSSSGGSWVDTVIDGNTFNGGTGGGAGAAISWWPQSAVASSHSNIKITNNTFNGCAAAQGVIVLLAEIAAKDTVYIYDLEVSGNTFNACAGTAIKAYVPKTGQCKGVKIFRNTITNQGRIGNLGGGIALGGFAQSTTANFGQNVVEYNYADGLQGTTGFANIMYGSYIVRYNTAKNIESAIYDGIGLLFDLGADKCEAYGNYLENLTGPTDFTAGAAIGIIYSATNITCYGNVAVNCRMGVFYGNQNSGMVSNIYNNTFINCGLAGIHGNPTTYPSDSNECKNNIFIAASSAAKAIRYDSGTWNKESSNVFYGFSTGTQAIHSSSITDYPDLDNDYRPRATQVKRKGAYIAGRDYYGKRFYNPPNIGAVEDITTTPRYIFKP